MPLFKPTPAALRTKLEAAQSNRSELKSQLGALVIQAEGGGETDRAALEQHRASIVAAETRISDLQAALRSAEAQEHRTRVEQLLRLKETQERGLRKILRARDAATVRLASLLPEVLSAWREMIATSEAARVAAAAMPGVDEMKFAGIGRCFPYQLAQAVRRELGRLDGRVVSAAGAVFPGTALAPGGTRQGDRPEDWASLSNDLHKASELAMAMLKRATSGTPDAVRGEGAEPEPASRTAQRGEPEPEGEERQ